jgi:hypothetical protein
LVDHRGRRRPAGRGSALVWLVAVFAVLLLTGAVAVVGLSRPAPGTAVGAGPVPTGTTPSGTPSGLRPGASGVPSAPSAPSSPAATRSATSVPASPNRVSVSRKKGVSAWYFDGVTRALRDVRATWYYNWGLESGAIPKPAGVEYVPMIWGAKSVDAATLSRVRGQGHTLLGFNEPDLGSQANMSVAQALDLWPQLMATGMRLGSPAPAMRAPDPNGWLDGFMSGAAARGYRVDFIALHWYGADFTGRAVDQLRTYLDATYQRYHKPIWLTEFALTNFTGATPTYPTQAQQADFARTSTAMLERLPYVERYAWFALPTSGPASSTGLYRNGGTPTAVGTAYRAA